MTKEKSLSVYASLHRIQKELKAPKQTNKNISFKSRSAEQILDAAKEFLAEGEVIILNDEIVHIGDRYYVKAVASLCLGSECVSSTAFAREQEESKMMQPPQITGASSSYARKYALGGLLAIDDSKDDPDQNAHPVDDVKKKAEPKPEATPEELAMRQRSVEISNALKNATTIKMLEITWQVNEKEIKTFPEKWQEGLKKIHAEKAAQLDVTAAG